MFWKRRIIRPAPVATHIDLGILYGIRKPSHRSRIERWVSEKSETAVLCIGMTVLIVFFVVCLKLWADGIV